MKKIHLSTESGQNARVLLNDIANELPEVILLTKTKEDTKTEKFHRGDKPCTPTSQSLALGDPEIDFENIGRILPKSSRGYRLPNETKLRGDFQVFVTTFLPNGEEKDKMPFKKRGANINDTFPIKMGKRLPIQEALQKYVFHNQYLLSHDDGVKYQFLYNIAKSLHEAQEMAILGAGPKSNAPLVLIEGGLPVRGFLHGEIQEGKYRLRLLTTRQELKKPDHQ
jgi:hypothetical protein